MSSTNVPGIPLTFFAPRPTIAAQRRFEALNAQPPCSDLAEAVDAGAVPVSGDLDATSIVAAALGALNFPTNPHAAASPEVQLRTAAREWVREFLAVDDPDTGARVLRVVDADGRIAMRFGRPVSVAEWIAELNNSGDPRRFSLRPIAV